MNYVNAEPSRVDMPIAEGHLIKVDPSALQRLRAALSDQTFFIHIEARCKIPTHGVSTLPGSCGEKYPIRMNNKQREYNF